MKSIMKGFASYIIKSNEEWFAAKAEHLISTGGDWYPSHDAVRESYKANGRNSAYCFLALLGFISLGSVAVVSSNLKSRVENSKTNAEKGSKIGHLFTLFPMLIAFCELEARIKYLKDPAAIMFREKLFGTTIATSLLFAGGIITVLFAGTTIGALIGDRFDKNPKGPKEILGDQVKNLIYGLDRG